MKSQNAHQSRWFEAGHALGVVALWGVLGYVTRLVFEANRFVGYAMLAFFTFVVTSTVLRRQRWDLMSALAIILLLSAWVAGISIARTRG